MCGVTLSRQYAGRNAARILTRHKQSNACKEVRSQNKDNDATIVQCPSCPEIYQRLDALGEHRRRRHVLPLLESRAAEHKSRTDFPEYITSPNVMSAPFTDDDAGAPLLEYPTRDDATMGRRSESPVDLNMPDRSPPRDNQRMDAPATTQVTPKPTITPADSRFDCPWFQAALAKHRPRTCTNPILMNMVDLCRHAVSGREPHASFLRHCRHCKKHSTDQQVFKTEHGDDGELCIDEAIDDDAHSLWKQLYDLASEQLDEMEVTRHSCESHVPRSFDLTLICLRSNR
jgi:hypothetical protein